MVGLFKQRELYWRDIAQWMKGGDTLTQPGMIWKDKQFLPSSLSSKVKNDPEWEAAYGG